MKKEPKKLVLAKETVRKLEEADLGKATGGTYTFGSCPCYTFSGDVPCFC